MTSGLQAAALPAFRSPPCRLAQPAAHRHACRASRLPAAHLQLLRGGAAQAARRLPCGRHHRVPAAGPVPAPGDAGGEPLAAGIPLAHPAQVGGVLREACRRLFTVVSAPQQDLETQHSSVRPRGQTCDDCELGHNKRPCCSLASTTSTPSCTTPAPAEGFSRKP